jgi:hypothetical protein
VRILVDAGFDDCFSFCQSGQWRPLELKVGCCGARVNRAVGGWLLAKSPSVESIIDAEWFDFDEMSKN